MPQNHLFLRIVLGVICLGHALVGLLAFISGQKAMRIGSQLYGANFTPDGQFEYIIRPLGAYMLVLSFLQGAALTDPQRYKAVIDANLLLFFLRQFQRIWFVKKIRATFGIAAQTHWSSTAFYLMMALLLLFGRLRLEVDAGQG